MKKRTRRSPCPVACALDLLGDRWTLLIVRDLMAGKTHFHEFASSPEKISTNILTDRLEHLQRSGVIDAVASTLRTGSKAYELTPLGRSMRPVLQAIKDWGLTNIKGTAARIATEQDSVGRVS